MEPAHSVWYHAAEFAPSAQLAASLRREAGRLGTPFFAYDGARLDEDARALAAAFAGSGWIRLYSLKANALPGIVARVASHGLGANAVSRGELALAARAGVPPARSALEGIGKAPADLRTAVDLATEGRPLLWVSIESADEAAALAALARVHLPRRRRLDVLLRLNPGVEPDTHAGLAVGRSDSKFGLAASELPRAVEAGGGPGGPLRFRGIHVHVGSQLASADAWGDGVRSGLRAFAELARVGDDADTLDLGGGFPAGVPRAPGLDQFAAAAAGALREARGRGRPARAAVEPGRALVARAGWLVGRVLHVRDRAGRQVVIDAGMTELVRPALYGAEHPAFALTSLGRPVPPGEPGTSVTLDGPICESTDRLGRATLPPVERGDLIAVGLAGAYASVMASSYNGRPHPAEALLEPDGRRITLRRRGTLRSLP